MTREELDKKIELTLAQNRVAIEQSRRRSREFDQFAAIHTVRTERALRELREAFRRR
jgi:hypothetical protein